MGKKKFIDKKKAATFTLVYREFDGDDDSDAPSRVFTRVDAGEGYVKGFSDDDPRFYQQSSEYGDGQGDAFDEGIEERDGFVQEEDDNSRFADAHEESGDEEETVAQATKRSALTAVGLRKELSEEKRRELIDLGFPDDGYDYLRHLRKIGTPGVGAAFVPATRFEATALRTDVKVYDATKVQVQPTLEESNEAEQRAIELVSSSSQPVRRPLSKEGVLDADILAALENSDGSQFDSADELEDEFVILANDGVEERDSLANVASASGRSQDVARSGKQSHIEDSDEDFYEEDDVEEVPLSREDRPARFLDEQFETLALREYDDDDLGELDEDDPTTRGHADISDFSSVLSEFLTDKSCFKERYETPAEEKKGEILTIPSAAQRAIGSSFDKEVTSSMIIHSGVDHEVIKKTLEYTSEDDKEVVLEEPSDDEKEHWDCETIVSTLSNLDNHPGKIHAPGPVKSRIKLQDVEKSENGIIRLGGKQKLPLDYLPRRALAPVKEEERPVSSKGASTVPGKTALRRAGETPEEKKARKAAIKEERREARAGKKALKLMYREDSQRAQRGAAVTGPASIHLP